MPTRYSGVLSTLLDTVDAHVFCIRGHIENKTFEREFITHEFRGAHRPGPDGNAMPELTPVLNKTTHTGDVVVEHGGEVFVIDRGARTHASPATQYWYFIVQCHNRGLPRTVHRNAVVALICPENDLHWAEPWCLLADPKHACRPRCLWCDSNALRRQLAPALQLEDGDRFTGRVLDTIEQALTDNQSILVRRPNAHRLQTSRQRHRLSQRLRKRAPSYHEKLIEPVIAPIDACFRLPRTAVAV